jgi:ribonuclease E
MLLRGAGVLALSGVIIAVVSSEGLLPGKADEPRLAATSIAPPEDEQPAQPVAIPDPLPALTDTAMTTIAPDAIAAAKEAVRRAARGEAAETVAAIAEPPPATPRAVATPAAAPRVEQAPASVRVEAHSAPPATAATAALEAALAAKAAASAGTKRVATPPVTGSVSEGEQAAPPAQAEHASSSAATAELEAALAAKVAALRALSPGPPAASAVEAQATASVVAATQPDPPTASAEGAAPAELPVLQNAALDLSQDPTLLQDEGSTEQDLAAPLPRPRPEPPPNAIKRTASRSRDWGNLGSPPNCGEKHAYWRYTDRKTGKREWYCK